MTMAVLAEKAFIGLTEEETALIDDVPGLTRPMTYEEYMESPEEMARYDIIDGYKRYRLYGPENNRLPNPTRQHQRLQGNIGESFRGFARRTGRGRAILPPCDIFITNSPRLRTRQPDMIFVSNEILVLNPPEDNPAPLNPAPELVVEIVSPSDRPSVLRAKIADYRSVGVRKIWVARWRGRTVEVIALSWDEIATVATYGAGETAASLTFPDLTVAVDDIFAE